AARNAAARIGGRELLDQRVGLAGRRPIGEHHVVARRRERAHDRRAEAAAATGDQRPPLGCHFAHHAGSRASTSEPFCPPKPTELDIPPCFFASRATLGPTSSVTPGSGTL